MEVVAQRVFEPFYMWLDISLSLRKRKTKLSFTNRIVENNHEKVKDYENVSEYLA